MSQFRTPRLAHSACVFVPMLLAAMASGCAFKVLRPEVVTVRRAPDGQMEEMRYPLRIVVHDEKSFWDPHQIKSNFIGLSDLELVHCVDLMIDGVTLGHSHQPVENSFEWIKNQYAKLPRCAAVNITDQFCWAMGVEKTSLGRRALFVPRIVYFVDWMRYSLGELNRVAGHGVPWNGGLVPKKWTARPNRGLDGAEGFAVASYIRVAQGIDWSFDRFLDGGEWCYGKTVWAFAAPFVRPAKAEPSKP